MTPDLGPNSIGSFVLDGVRNVERGAKESQSAEQDSSTCNGRVTQREAAAADDKPKLVRILTRIADKLFTRR